MNIPTQELTMLMIEEIKLTRLLPYGESGKHYSSPKTTRGHPHTGRRDGKPRFAKTCRICKEETIIRY